MTKPRITVRIVSSAWTCQFESGRHAVRIAIMRDFLLLLPPIPRAGTKEERKPPGFGVVVAGPGTATVAG